MASIVDTSVKHAYSSMAGAPIISGTAGALIAVLDAFLVTGWGSKAVDLATISGGVCRLNFASGKSAAQEHAVILVAGASPAGINGEQKVTAVANGWVEFKTDLPDGTITGSISFKMAPLGWEKVFSKTNVAVYRSADPAGTRCFLRVDDTDAKNARVMAYEGMTSVDDGVGAYPLPSQIAGGGYWPKASTVSAASCSWSLFGDSHGFVLHTHTLAESPGISGSVWGFGDLEPVKSGDAYASVLFCAASDVSSATDLQSSSLEHVSPAGGTNAFLPRSFTGIGSCIKGIHGAEGLISGTGVAGAVAGSLLPTYPNGAGNSLFFTRKAVAEPIAGLRGLVRGLYMPAQSCHLAFSKGDMLDGVGVSSGRKLLAVKCGAPAGGSSAGVLFVDITGPWEV